MAAAGVLSDQELLQEMAHVIENNITEEDVQNINCVLQAIMRSEDGTVTETFFINLKYGEDYMTIAILYIHVMFVHSCNIFIHVCPCDVCSFM